jgi:hypothetical protein
VLVLSVIVVVVGMTTESTASSSSSFKINCDKCGCFTADDSVVAGAVEDLFVGFASDDNHGCYNK